MLTIVALATALRLVAVGGALYETGVIDPRWPHRPDLIQPNAGGISRVRFWLPVHVAYEASAVVALVTAWSMPLVRSWLIAALILHATMRIWSAVTFIPLALRFERGDPALSLADALRWVRCSRLRLPLDIACAIAMMGALVGALRP